MFNKLVRQQSVPGQVLRNMHRYKFNGERNARSVHSIQERSRVPRAQLVLGELEDKDVTRPDCSRRVLQVHPSTVPLGLGGDGVMSSAMIAHAQLSTSNSRRASARRLDDAHCGLERGSP